MPLHADTFLAMRPTSFESKQLLPAAAATPKDPANSIDRRTIGAVAPDFGFGIKRHKRVHHLPRRVVTRVELAGLVMCEDRSDFSRRRATRLGGRGSASDSTGPWVARSLSSASQVSSLT